MVEPIMHGAFVVVRAVVVDGAALVTAEPAPTASQAVVMAERLTKWRTWPRHPHHPDDPDKRWAAATVVIGADGVAGPALSGLDGLPAEVLVDALDEYLAELRA